MPPMTRGPLPARVYWRRRMAVLGTALLLVVGIARLLGGSSDGSDGVERAVQSAAETTASATTSAETSTGASAAATEGSTQGTKGKKGKKKSKSSPSPTQPVLAEPDGVCRGSDITVTPEVGQAVAGRDVQVSLVLRTLESEACIWQVSRNTLTVDITSGKDDIWSSRQCPAAIPAREVVVRKAASTRVDLIWTQAKRSGDRCTNGTDWAMPGWYHVTASALGGEPADVQFELTTPVAGTITKTATPSQSPQQSPGQSPGQSAGQSQGTKPSKKPQHSPSGAVEPNGTG